MKYIVIGGVYANTQFDPKTLNEVEVYGPYDLYEEALREWKSQMWLRVDNALHRLQVYEIPA